MNINDLNAMAVRSIYEAWGVGITGLKNSSEAAAPYYRFLHKVVSIYKPDAVVECGVYLGVASAHMAAGNADTIVIGLDMQLRRDVLERYTNVFKNLRYHEAESTSKSAYDFVKTTLNGRKLGILFLDSEHNGITPLNEYMKYREFFAHECLIACDDILDKRMEEFWLRLPGEKVEAHYLHPSPYKGVPEPGFGYSIVRTNHA